jgi:hypothetical protein
MHGDVIIPPSSLACFPVPFSNYENKLNPHAYAELEGVFRTVDPHRKMILKDGGLTLELNTWWLPSYLEVV